MKTENGNVVGSATKPRSYHGCLGTPIEKSPPTNEKARTNAGNGGTVGTGRFSDFVQELYGDKTVNEVQS